MKSLLRIPATFALFFLLGLGFAGCSQESAPEPVSTAPINEVDGMINDYEKVANEYVRVARKHRDGDVSITIRVIDLENQTRATAAKLQQESARMSPSQAQRVASISSKTSPYMQN